MKLYAVLIITTTLLTALANKKLWAQEEVKIDENVQLESLEDLTLELKKIEEENKPFSDEDIKVDLESLGLDNVKELKEKKNIVNNIDENKAKNENNIKDKASNEIDKVDNKFIDKIAPESKNNEIENTKYNPREIKKDKKITQENLNILEDIANEGLKEPQEIEAQNQEIKFPEIPSIPKLNDDEKKELKNSPTLEIKDFIENSIKNTNAKNIKKINLEDKKIKTKEQGEKSEKDNKDLKTGKEAKSEKNEKSFIESISQGIKRQASTIFNSKKEDNINKDNNINANKEVKEVKKEIKKEENPEEIIKSKSKIEQEKELKEKNRIKQKKIKEKEEKKVKRLELLRQQYIKELKSDNYIDEANFVDFIEPQKKELDWSDKFSSNHVPAPPILDRYRGNDNKHIPVILSPNEKVTILFDAITSRNISAFNQAYREIVNPDIRNFKGDTILTFAVLMRRYPVIYSVLHKGADPDLPNLLGHTPLDIAIAMQDLKSMQILLDMNADVNYTNKYGMTYLMDAVRIGFLPIVQLLIEHKAEINAENDDGFTALDLAHRYKREIIVKLLLKNGAVIGKVKKIAPKKKSMIKDLENRWKPKTNLKEYNKYSR